LLRIRPYKTLSGAIDGAVMVLIDVDSLKRAQQYAQSIVATVREPLLVLDGDLRVRTANASFYRVFRVDEQETEGRLLHDLGNGQWNIPELRRALTQVLDRDAEVIDFGVEHEFA